MSVFDIKYKTINKVFKSAIFGLCCIYCTTVSVYGQLNTSVLNDFNKTIFNSYILNPSATDSTYLFNARFTNINELGVFKNISRFYLDVDRRVPSKNNNGDHFIGVQIINSKQGDFINRSRLQVRYSWMIQVSKKAALSSGIGLGFVNYSFLTSQGGTGGSDLGPDGALGLHYLRKNFSLGFSVQQIFNAVIIPVSQSFELNRLYNLDVLKRIPIALKSSITSQAILQIPESYEDIYYGLALMGNINEFFLAGIGNYNLSKTSFNLGVENIPLLKAKFQLVLTYTVYHSAILLGDNSFEIFLSIKK